MEPKKRINYINEYLKGKYGERTLKIGIDGGFSCPNRDGTKGYGGCLFCSERGSGEHLPELSIEKQLEDYFESYRSSRANAFILYFQNFSNTYAPIKTLKERYDTSISVTNQIILNKKLTKRIVGLQVATRPDCIDKEICELLVSYTPKLDVSVELGLQTSNDKTRAFLNCGYSAKEFQVATDLLHKHHISVVGHIMVGLPYETHQDIVNTVDFVNSQQLDGIKIHSTYVVENTLLADLYRQKKYSPISLEEYLSETIYIITHLNPKTVIHRISGDAPKNILVAPSWNAHKKLVLNGVINTLHNNNLWQGMYY